MYRFQFKTPALHFNFEGYCLNRQIQRLSIDDLDLDDQK